MNQVVLLSLLLAGSVAASAIAQTTTTLYKSVGPDGNVVYGDRPPTDGRTAKALPFESLPASPLSSETLAYLEQLEHSSVTAASIMSAAATALTRAGSAHTVPIGEGLPFPRRCSTCSCRQSACDGILDFQLPDVKIMLRTARPSMLA